MKWLHKNALAAALGLVALLGVCASGEAMYRALRAASLMLAIAQSSASIEGGIHQALEESQHFVLLAIGDPQRAPYYLSRADACDGQVQAYLHSLASLELPDESHPSIADFAQKWAIYWRYLQEVSDLVRKGSLQEARAAEDGPAKDAFEQARNSFARLNTLLLGSAAQYEQTIRRALYQASGEMLVLALASTLFAITLSWSYRRAREYAFIHQRNQELAQAEALERDRGLVLELAGRHEPLPQVLSVLALMIEKHIPHAAACISVIEDEGLSHVVAPNLGSEFLDRVHRPELLRILHFSESGAQPVEQPSGGAHPVPAWHHFVLSNSGLRIGAVHLYWREPGELTKPEMAMLQGATHLASIVIQHRMLYEQLSYQAQRDPLTELPNRRLFQERLERTLRRCARRGTRAGVLLIDLDRFKQVNDLLGHRVGDAMLQEIARRVSSCLSHSDTLARIGGDEFTVLLTSISGTADAEALAHRILREISRPMTLFGHELTVSASVGLALYPDHGRDPATLVRNADLAMYHAKSRGKNGCATYVPELGEALLRRMNIEKFLEAAIESGKLQVHYQLQTDFDRRIVGCEALVRWNSPNLGVVSPEQIISVAEESGLIVPIGSWVMRRACEQMAEWLRHGYQTSKIAVNVSARQLAQSDFVEQVRQVLEASGLPPEYLELELTETALMQDVEDCLSRMSALRALGVAIAIDDFGTGYSSLVYLQRLPVQSVKIDQSFVRGIDSGPQSTLPLINAVVELAHGLGLNVLAEGVETERQFQALRQAGCDAVQGYLLHRPLPAADVEDLFRTSAQGLLRLRRAVSEPVAPETEEIPIDQYD